MTVIISRGAHVRAQAKGLPWSGKGITTYAGPSGGAIALWGSRSATYEQIVFTQPWVYAAVRTFYLAIGRLPEKTYTGLTGEDRKRTRDTPSPSCCATRTPVGRPSTARARSPTTCSARATTSS